MTQPLPAIRVGTAGWSIPGAHGEKFPVKGTHLERYAQVFSCVEINSSFYRSHRATTWQRWAESVPKHFRFSVKAPKTISHDARMNDFATPLLDTFLAEIANLGEHLGPVLFQFPPSLKFDANSVRGFLCALRERFAGNVVFEPRHRSWFAKAPVTLLEEFRIARCAADPACVADAASPGGWRGLSYYRMHGSPRMYYSQYDDTALLRLADSARSGDAAETWCIFDNTALGAAAVNAMELTRFLTDA